MKIYAEEEKFDACTMRVTSFLNLLGVARGSLPYRFRILLLCREPRPSSNIAKALGMTPGFASKQLTLMHKTGLMDMTQDKNKRLYQTRPELIPIITFSMELFRDLADS